MKKTIAALLIAALLLALAGCGSQIEIRFTFKDDPVPVVQTTEAPATEAPTTQPPTTEAPTTEPETTAANVDTGNAD